ncbi:beta-ketoacyl-ACP synthase 3 [Spirochaeta lutea]|uniref:beta-ketoacyl-ACP synthase 3 n=1 Tax=Spirochaeta lutea TaxID=1480694 RepID=UPI0007A762E8|nr:beta-ketoacyl-ACP synthase 3 [Spirochaeta lutea]
MSEQTFIASIPMPFVGESIVDGILVAWLVKPGDTITKGQHIADIETEKSTWDFEAPCAGTVESLACDEGDVVDVGATLLTVETSDHDVKHLSGAGAEDHLGSAGAGSTAVPGQAGPGDASAPEGGGPGAGSGSSTAASGPSRGNAAGASRTQLSPRLKKMVRDNNITEAELATIPGTGPEGRLTAADIGGYLDAKEAASNGAGGLLPCFVRGIGSYVPGKVVANSAFLQDFDDITEDYIEKVTGIKERRWVDQESTSDLAFQASKQALKKAGITPGDLDLIILATTTPDMPLPATACALQQKLGCTTIPAFDIAAACSGWLYALSVGRQFIQTGGYTNVLVVAGEVMSRFTDKTDRATAFLFGDGAGAAVLSSNPGGQPSASHRLGDLILQADSEGYDIIYRKAGGSAYPPGTDLEPGDEYWFMDGGRMFRGAVTAFTQIIEAAAQAQGLTLDQIDWVVPHQANRRILKAVAKKLGIPMERVFFNIEKYGNTSGATIPLCLSDMEEQGLLKPGQRVLLCSVGAGLTVAGGIIEW